MQKKRWSAACALSALLAGVTVAAGNSEQAQTTSASATAVVKAQTLCPVMGGPVDRSQSVDCDGKRVYVCCGACIDKLKKDPDKYVSQLEAEGITPEPVPRAAVAKTLGTASRTDQSRSPRERKKRRAVTHTPFFQSAIP